MWVQSLGQEEPLWWGMATHSCLENPRTGEPDRLWSMGLQKDIHD